MKRTILFAISCFFLLFVGACKDAGNPVVATQLPITDSVSFKNDILPLLTGSKYGCTGCHGGQNNLFLDSYGNVMLGNSFHGPIITQGNGEGSIIVKKLRGTATFGSRMPFGGSAMASADIQKISDWITQGAKNN